MGKACTKTYKLTTVKGIMVAAHSQMNCFALEDNTFMICVIYTFLQNLYRSYTHLQTLYPLYYLWVEQKVDVQPHF